MHEDFVKTLGKIQPDDTVLKLHREVLVTEAANQLGNLNEKIKHVQGKINTIADNRLSAIRKFNADQLTHEEKTDLINDLDSERKVYTRELRQLEK